MWGDIFHYVLFHTVRILPHLHALWLHTQRNQLLKEELSKRSLPRDRFQCSNATIFLIRQKTATKFRFSREWSDGEVKIRACKGRVPEGGGGRVSLFGAICSAPPWSQLWESSVVSRILRQPPRNPPTGICSLYNLFPLSAGRTCAYDGISLHDQVSNQLSLR